MAPWVYSNTTADDVAVYVLFCHFYRLLAVSEKLHLLLIFMYMIWYMLSTCENSVICHILQFNLYILILD